MTARSGSQGPVLQHQQQAPAAVPASGPTNGNFKVPRGKGLNRPTTWFTSGNFGKSSSSSASSSSSTSTTIGPSGSSSGSGSTVAANVPSTSILINSGASPLPNPFNVSGFKSPFPSSKGKHKLSPSPSPSPRNHPDEDFVMISPVRPACGLGVHAGHSRNTGAMSPSSSPSRLAYLQTNSNPMLGEDFSSSSPLEESPTPACGMASAAARLKLVDDESPIRRVPGQSRSLARAHKGREAPRSSYLSADRELRAGDQSSPLKFASTRYADEDEDDDSPQLPPTPLMNNGLPVPPPQPLFPPIRPSRSTDSASSASPFSLQSKGEPSSSRIPRLSTSHPLRARAGTDAERPTLGLSTKKAISLDQISAGGDNELFGSSSHIHVRKTRPASTFGPSGISGLPSSASTNGRAHKRINSGDHHGLAAMANGASGGSMSRSFGAKSLALSLTPNLGQLPDFSYSNSSLSSLSTANLTPPASAFSPAEPPIFEDVKPLQEAFDQPLGTVGRKFKPRDSGVSMGDDNDDKARPGVPISPPSVMKSKNQPVNRLRRPAMLKRTSSLGDHRSSDLDAETPGIGPMPGSGWPNRATFDFLGEGDASLSFAASGAGGKPSMPGTPVKKGASAFVPPRQGIGHSSSQPTLVSGPFDEDITPSEDAVKANAPAARSMFPPPSTKKLGPPPPTMKKRPGSGVPALTLTSTSSPEWVGSGMDTDDIASSPTVRVGGAQAQAQAEGLKPLVVGAGTGKITRIGLLRRSSNGASESEEEGTPTKDGGDRSALAARSDLITPTPSPRVAPSSVLPTVNRPRAGSTISAATAGSSLMPRLSLPALPPPKPHPPRTLHHRQSHPAASSSVPEEEDVFEKRFITLEVLGKGAFSTVVKVQDRHGEGIYAVKKARGVFDGVKDRLRHLEEVDILRHLSRKPCDHVIKFEDAWEQNRQLFIQTELCLGSLAFFLEEYGRVVERLDEGRVWKIVRELSDGINHIHSHGVIHFDIKPANILISSAGSLKIGDFGLATRWPRVEPAKILEGSGLGAGNPTSSAMLTKGEKLEREGDRVYMPPEMLRGVFVMAADIFSFGLVILEVSTNICVPDGGAPWQALRSNDFSVVDLSPLSPALCDLITQCMSADPASRPTIAHLVNHPVVQRAKSGKPALAPEDKEWLVDVLSGGFLPPAPLQAGTAEDVEMSEG
ncbi:hypothetical protein IAU60_006721 [Kwoniella sp. DSM 27419]